MHVSLCISVCRMWIYGSKLWEKVVVGFPSYFLLCGDRSSESEIYRRRKAPLQSYKQQRERTRTRRLLFTSCAITHCSLSRWDARPPSDINCAPQKYRSMFYERRPYQPLVCFLAPRHRLSLNPVRPVSVWANRRDRRLLMSIESPCAPLKSPLFNGGRSQFQANCGKHTFAVSSVSSKNIDLPLSAYFGNFLSTCLLSMWAVEFFHPSQLFWYLRQGKICSYFWWLSDWIFIQESRTNLNSWILKWQLTTRDGKKVAATIFMQLSTHLDRWFLHVHVCYFFWTQIYNFKINFFIYLHLNWKFVPKLTTWRLFWLFLTSKLYIILNCIHFFI